MFATPRSTELLQGSFQDRHFWKAYISALTEGSFVLVNSFSKNSISNKNPTSKIDIAASSGGKGKHVLPLASA
jgi:hypothetical protein